MTGTLGAITGIFLERKAQKPIFIQGFVRYQSEVADNMLIHLEAPSLDAGWEYSCMDFI